MVQAINTLNTPPPGRGDGPSTGLALLLLAVLNGAAHFLPPERSALAPDDYTYLVRVHGKTLADLPRLVADNPSRPLSEVFLILQTWTVDGNPVRGLLLLCLSSTLLLFVCHLFFVTVLGERRSALVASAVYCLLPQKLESYHTPVFINVNVACTVYLASAFLFFKAVQRSRPALAAASVVLYALGVFWYEVGFFLPLALWAWTRMEGRPVASRAPWLLFGLPASAYLAYRFLHPDPAAGRAVGLTTRPLVDVFHHYAGAFFALDVANGVYNFVRMEGPWLLAAVLIDAGLVWILYRLATPATPALQRAGTVSRGAAWFVILLLPLFLRGSGGVAGRHLILPSVGLALVMGTLLMRSKPRHTWHWGALVAAALVVSQGNGWAQVVACRINAAVYRAVGRADIAGARAVVFDLRSFTDRIPSSWARLDFDLLSSYYGAQAFADWGLSSMVHLTAGHDRTPVYFAVVRPARSGPDRLTFVAGRGNGMRSMVREPVTLPAEGTVVIGFADAFGEGFQP